MKHFLLFVDFSDTSSAAFEQALNLAATRESRLSICHIMQSQGTGVEAEIRVRMQPYLDAAAKVGVPLEPIIETGDLFLTAQSVVSRLKPDLILVGTHGSKGIRLNLLGSAIHKLVREVDAPTLVLGKGVVPVASGFDRILIPPDVQRTYMDGVKMACELLSANGEITLFEIEDPNSPLDAAVSENIENAQAELDKCKVKWKRIKMPVKPHEIGFAAQTLSYMRSDKTEMIVISSAISERFKLFGKLDKEAILLNEDGIMVLCMNS